MIQSHDVDDQIQKMNLNTLALANESLINLMDLFFETRRERNAARVAYFLEQKHINVGAINRGSRMRFSETRHSWLPELPGACSASP